MPDILVDWEIQRRRVRSYSPWAYLRHLWSELWELPPPVDESALSEKIVLATHVPGIGNQRAEFSHRDKVFLLGRQAREFPPLSAALRLAITVQFLVTLTVGYSVLLTFGKEQQISEAAARAGVGAYLSHNGTEAVVTSVFDGPDGKMLVKYIMAFICIVSVLSLQSIKMHYK